MKILLKHSLVVWCDFAREKFKRSISFLARFHPQGRIKNSTFIFYLQDAIEKLFFQAFVTTCPFVFKGKEATDVLLFFISPPYTICVSTDSRSNHSSFEVFFLQVYFKLIISRRLKLWKIDRVLRTMYVLLVARNILLELAQYNILKWVGMIRAHSDVWVAFKWGRYVI